MSIKRQVFYSFCFKDDVRRVAQIRNIGSIEDNKPVSENDWETVQRGGEAAIKKWIDDNMKNRSCVIVLIGKDTANRKWVKYEIEKAWNEGKGLFGIYIHNIKDPLLCKEGMSGFCSQGKNPFEEFHFKKTGKKLSDVVKCYNPKAWDAYNDISNNIEKWVEEAIKIRN